MLTAIYLILLLGTLGAFDTLWFHEYKQQLPRNASAKVELRLHAARDFAYGIVFASLAWIIPSGFWAWILLAILLFEIGITLWDFIEEDMSRRLPPGERVAHTVMAIVYGAFLAYILPVLFAWTSDPTALEFTNRGVLSWILSAFAGGVIASGIRDLVASFRMADHFSERERELDSMV